MVRLDPDPTHSQLTTVSSLCHGQCLVNDIRLMELGKIWDTCRISRKLEIVVVSDTDMQDKSKVRDSCRQ